MIDAIKETSLNMTVVTVDNPSNILINNTRSNKTQNGINNGSNYSLELSVQLKRHVDTVEMTLVLEGTPEVLYIIIPERSKSGLPQYTTRVEGGEVPYVVCNHSGPATVAPLSLTRLVFVVF